MIQNWKIALSLVRRDYAVQYAGTMLGIVWVLVQYIFQIALYWLIFGFILKATMPAKWSLLAGQGDYLSYLLGGMLLWLPLAEMLQRSGGILVDNRNLIRRTAIGLHGFLRLPLVEAILHYVLISLPVLVLLAARGHLQWSSAPLAIVLGVCTLIFFSGWSAVLARVSVILRDVSPLLGLCLQILFWLTPLVYVVPESLHDYFLWNPFFALTQLHRALLLGGSVDLLAILVSPGLVGLVLISMPIFWLSRHRLEPLVGDHL